MGLINIDVNGRNDNQILRDALALSLITGHPFKLTHLQPLNNNQIAYIKAAAAISDATVEEGALNSTELLFSPGKIKNGLLTIPTPPANNIALTVQTILPALARSNGPTIIQLKGVTAYPNSPSVDFLSKSYLPQLNKMGGFCGIRCPQRGFYPAGGGRVQLEVHPASGYKPLELTERGDLLSRHATVINANLPGNIAERELALVRLQLGWSSKETTILFDNSMEAGNVLNMEVAFQNVTLLHTSVGQRGVRAETVAENSIQAIAGYLASTAPVDEHLAHQLLLPMLAMGGGEFLTCQLSEHSKSLMALMQQFAPGHFTIKPQGLNTLVAIRAL